MAEEQLRKAYALMKQGQTKESLALVQSVLKQDKNNVAAWWLMTNLLADDPERQKKALEKVLSLDPKHKLALQLQAKLSGSPAPKATPKPQPKPQAALSTEEINFSWAKLEAKEVGKKTVDEEKASRMVKVASYGMLGFLLLIGVAIGSFWAYKSYQDSINNTPQATILRFYNAAFSGDAITARTMVCTDMQATFDTIAGIYVTEFNNQKAQLGEGAIVSFDFSGLTAEVVSSDATTATVRVAGQYSLSSPQATEPLVENIVTNDANLDELRFENGVWCVAKVQ